MKNVCVLILLFGISWTTVYAQCVKYVTGIHTMYSMNSEGDSLITLTVNIQSNGHVVVQRNITANPLVAYPDITYVLGPGGDWDTATEEDNEIELVLNRNLTVEKYWLISFDDPDDDNVLQALSDKVTIKCHCIKGMTDAECSGSFKTSQGITCFECIKGAGCMTFKQKTVRAKSKYHGSMVLVKGNSIEIL